MQISGGAISLGYRLEEVNPFYLQYYRDRTCR